MSAPRRSSCEHDVYEERARRAERRGELDAFLRLPHYSDAEVAAIRALLNECGAADAVRGSIAALSSLARAALQPLPDNPWRGMLDALVEQMSVRSV